MSIMKIAIFSDFHLGVINDQDIILDIQFKFIENMIDYLKKNNISEVIFMGDWFHSRKSINVKILDASYKILDMFQKNNIHIYMIVGNHDIYLQENTEINSIKVYQEMNVSVVSSPIDIMLNEKTISLIPWGFKITKPVDFIFGHFSFQGALYSNAMLNEHGENPDEMINFASLIFSGHFHYPKEYSYKKGKIVVVGSPLQLTWGEIDEAKGFYVLDLETNYYEMIGNTTLPIRHKINLSDMKNDEFKKKLNNIVKGNFIKLVIDEEIGYEKILKIENFLNKMNPIRSIEVEYFKKSNKCKLPELVNMPERSFNKYDVIKTYVDNLGKDSNQKFDTNILMNKISELYNSTEQIGRNDE